MRTVPPAGFDVASFYERVVLFQTWDVFPGQRAQGAKDVAAVLARLGAPLRMDGLRVLEIAPWNGFFGFECLRRGARELVALGPDDPDATGFSRTVQLLGIGEQVRYVRGSVYDMAAHRLGTFDVVMFLGVIYHLRHPLLAIDLLHDHCAPGSLFLVDSPLADGVDFVARPDRRSDLKSPWESVQEIPLAHFVRGGVDAPLADDPFNWFVPNSACLRAWVRSSGFEIVHDSADGNWHFIGARPRERPFAPGLEGFNPAVQQKHG